MVYLGIDVSKAKLHACLLLDDTGKCKTKVVDNSAAGIVTLLDWTARHGVAANQLHAMPSGHRRLSRSRRVSVI